MLSIAVDGRFSNPGVALSLYYDRSALVHGARATAEEDDYQRAFWLASSALRNYVLIANQNPGVYTHSKLLDLIADDHTLTKLRIWVEDHKPWGYMELLKEIDKLLKRGAG